MDPPLASTADVRSFSAFITNKNGQHLFCRYWEPDNKPKALVFLAHGYGEHCHPYEPLALALLSEGYFPFAHDHVGHGQSDGARVHITHFNNYVEDVFMHTDEMRKKYPELPIFICGHSMGGAISILAGIQRPEYFKGILLIGPAVIPNPEIASPLKIALARILRWVAPKFPVGSLDLSLVSSCPKQIKAMEKDPLHYHGFAKAGFGATFIDALQIIQKKTPTIAFPFVIYQGEEDKICIPQGAIFMYENAISEDKTIKMYPNAYHSLLREPNGIAEEVIKEIVDWIIDRT